MLPLCVSTEGGYFPSSCGFDLHAELELYNGSVNTAHYLLHAANDTASYNRSYNEALQGIVTFAPGATYHVRDVQCTRRLDRIRNVEIVVLPVT